MSEGHERIKIPRSNKPPIEFLESSGVPPLNIQILHELRSNIPLYFEPFEMLRFNDNAKNTER